MSESNSKSAEDAEFLPDSSTNQSRDRKRRFLMPVLAFIIVLALVVAWWAMDWPSDLSDRLGADNGPSSAERLTQVEANEQDTRDALAELQAGQSAWQDQVFAETEARLSEAGQRDASQRARIQATIDNLNSSQVSLAQRIAQVEQRLLGLAAQATGGREVMQLTEIEFLLRHAMQRLQLAGDPDGARVVLQQARDSLESLSAPALNGVSQELTAVIAALESAPSVDLARISGQLLALERAVTDWPLSEATQAVENDEEKNGSEAGWWQRLKSGLGELVVVRKRADSDPVLLQVNEARALRGNVQIELTAARLAALRRDEAAFQSALAQAEQWRKQYFATDAESVRQAGVSLARLAGTDLDPSYPDLAPLLEQLQRQRSLMALPAATAPATAPTNPEARPPVLIEPVSEQDTADEPNQTTDALPQP